MAANERVKSRLFHRSGCEYIQEWMRMVSEYTKEDANSFGEGARPLRGLTTSGAGKRGLMVNGWTSQKRGPAVKAFFGHVMNNAAFRSIVEHS